MHNLIQTPEINSAAGGSLLCSTKHLRVAKVQNHFLLHLNKAECLSEVLAEDLIYLTYSMNENICFDVYCILPFFSRIVLF